MYLGFYPQQQTIVPPAFLPYWGLGCLNHWGEKTQNNLLKSYKQYFLYIKDYVSNQVSINFFLTLDICWLLLWFEEKKKQ